LLIGIGPEEGLANSFDKELSGKSVGFVGCSVSAMQLNSAVGCRAVMDNLEMRGCGCFAIKLYLQNQLELYAGFGQIC
jgi:hypothetical protein